MNDPTRTPTPQDPSYSDRVLRSAAQKTAGILIERRKLDVFKRHLDKGARTYTVHPTGDDPESIVVLKVVYSNGMDMVQLQAIVGAAHAECKR